MGFMVLVTTDRLNQNSLGRFGVLDVCSRYGTEGKKLTRVTFTIDLAYLCMVIITFQYVI